MYVREIKDLYNSIIEFNEKPEFWKTCLSSSPRYFLHLEEKGKHYFGLSKFCVFKDIEVEDYISTYRYKTNGGTARLIIQNRFNKNWVPRAEINSNVRNAFDNWISGFFPNYNLNNANFISISVNVHSKKKLKKVTPEELKKALEIQLQIGEVGEDIAYEHEINRLNIGNPSKYIERTSKVNVAAGFDIYTSYKTENRFIEVKSSITKINEFFITENEFNTLEKLQTEAYIYLVQITDFEKKEGAVYKIIQNPIKFLKENGLLKPIAYKVKI